MRPCLPPPNAGTGFQLRVWNTLAPRLHAAYDITGEGKTVAKFGWGRFVHMRSLEPEARDLDPKATQTTIWRWTDRNGDKLYQPGEVNLDPSSPDFVSGASGSTFVVNPDEKPPTTDEFSASLEHQLAGNIAVRATGIHSRNHDTLRVTNLLRPPSAYNIAISRPDPGPDGRRRQRRRPRHDPDVLGVSRPRLAGGRRSNDSCASTTPRADTRYTSIELAAVKRSSRGYQFTVVVLGHEDRRRTGPEQRVRSSRQSQRRDQCRGGLLGMAGEGERLVPAALRPQRSCKL